jgi:hypothetical protein
MTMRLPFVLSLSVSMFAMTLSIGCTQTAPEQAGGGEAPAAQADTDLDPHDVPITEEQKAELRDQTAEFTDAVATIARFRNEIEQETAAGIPEHPFRAHQALDKADLVLQWLPQIARQSYIPKSHWEAITTSANALRTLFDQVHLNIDNREDPGFAAVADDIDAKLAALQEIAAGRPSDTVSDD